MLLSMSAEWKMDFPRDMSLKSMLLYIHVERGENQLSKGYVLEINIVMTIGRSTNRLLKGYVTEVNVNVG